MTEHVAKLSQSTRQESGYILYRMAFLISLNQYFVEILFFFHESEKKRVSWRFRFFNSATENTCQFVPETSPSHQLSSILTFLVSCLLFFRSNTQRTVECLLMPQLVLSFF